jgi:putative toxin-antitoxin system antitoxin component (TIGR02293 family)
MTKKGIIKVSVNEVKINKADTTKLANGFITAANKSFNKGNSNVYKGYTTQVFSRHTQTRGRAKNTSKRIMKFKSLPKKMKLVLAHGDLGMVMSVRRGVKQADFKRIATISPFTVGEWSDFLNLSERTMQRYSKQKRAFAPTQSEKILEIGQLNLKGIEVFEDKNNFKLWLESKNIALGGMKPKDLLDTSIGIGMVKEELIRIEYGILA